MPEKPSDTPPDNKLAPQSGNSPTLMGKHSILRLKGVWPVLASAAAVVSTQISVLFSWGIRILNALDLADFTGTTFVEWLRWLFSPKGAQVLFVL
ncbi:MAG TPA: hypothetical protein VFX96_19455, partial [Pyrinomonadaceae bacterium]|nr:hypothetical protein [Pyrinomonadaceae bacterium]